jgi:hypothetical protein
MAKTGITLKVEDKGWKDAVSESKKLRKELHVGVQEEDAGDKYPDHDATVGQVAMWNEFGTQDIPARSFLRDWADENAEKIAKQIGADYMRVLFADEDEEAALEKRGSEYSRQIVGRIKRRIPPPNSPKTLARKKGTTPLIDTGLLVKSIKGKVE